MLISSKSRNFFEGKNVLVAGASGFVGSNLIDYLSQTGAVIRGTVHEKCNFRTVSGVEYVNCDLTMREDCERACADMDYVFMAAANSSGAAVMDKTPLAHLTPNAIMNTLMLEAAYKLNIKKFCFISSNTVYPVTDFAVSEEDFTGEFFEKYFIVGWMKRFSELMCQMYAISISEPMETLVVRPGNLYGPGDKYTWTESKVIAALIRRAVERHDPFEVWGDGNDIKDFLYIDDFIEGMIAAFMLPRPFSIFNVASGVPVTIKKALECILSAADYADANVIFDHTKPTMIPKRMIDIKKIKNCTGWEPKVNLSDGISRTVTWYRSQFSDQTPETNR